MSPWKILYNLGSDILKRVTPCRGLRVGPCEEKEREVTNVFLDFLPIFEALASTCF
jgi:hypothetical protein